MSGAKAVACKFDIIIPLANFGRIYAKHSAGVLQRRICPIPVHVVPSDIHFSMPHVEQSERTQNRYGLVIMTMRLMLIGTLSVSNSN